MSRFIRSTRMDAIAVLLSIYMGGCRLSNLSPADLPFVAPPELAVEEHALQGPPSLEPLTFVPLSGTKEETLRLPRAARAAAPRVPCQPACAANLHGAPLTATVRVTQVGSEEVGVVELARDGQIGFTLEVGDPCTIPPLWGLWTHDGHWFMEVAYVEPSREDGAAACDATGDIIRDGGSLNEALGYDESFGFQLLGGRPFYFFERDGQIGASYAGQEVPIRYTRVVHYQCCSGAALNLRSSPSTIDFFAEREGTWLYAEIRQAE